MGVEVAGAILAGILAGSVALIAFGADSSVELMSGLVVMSHLRSDYKGSEGLGHRTATMTSALLFALIPVVGGLSVYSYLMGVRTEGSLLGIGLAVVAVGLMPLLFYEKRRIGRETGCLSISIDAYATATCLLLSVALLGGLVGVYLTGFGWIDYVATAVILSFIGKEALEAWRESRTGRQPTLDSSGRIFTP